MAGTPNIGTLVGAAIRPFNDADLISTAYANEIKGGIHGYATLLERDNIIIERRQWGMLVTVYDDGINNATYQLTYNTVSGPGGTDLGENLNWVEYTGASSTSISEWQNSVKSILTTVPPSPSDGDRYLVGLNQNSTITGAPWAGISGGFISQYNSATTIWTNTLPTNGMTVRVDDQYNSLYKYEGDYYTGQWVKEKLTQVHYVDFIGNGVLYTTTISPTFSVYDPDTIFLSKFSTSNIGSISININGIGIKIVKKPSISGLVLLTPNDIIPENIYSLSYDFVNDCFQFIKTYSNDSFNIKYYIEPNDYIVVPPYCQYWVYGDLTVDGTILNYGKVIVANGELIIGTFGIVENYGDVDLITIGGGNVDLTSIEGHLIPSVGNTYDIGATAGYNWRDLYLSGNTIHLGDSTISSVNSGVLVSLISTTNLNLQPTTEPLSPVNGDIYFNGTSSYIYSATWSRIYTTNKNTIIVQKSGGDFTSIKAAVDSINDSSESNGYIINVGPGDFYEDEIDFTGKTYISVVGSDIRITKIIANTPTQNLFIVNDSVELSFMTIKGVGPGYAGILCQDISEDPIAFTLAHKVSFYDCDTNVLVRSTTLPSSFYGEYIDFNGTFSYGIKVESNNGILAFANCENYYTEAGATGSIANYVFGTNSTLNILGAVNTGFGDDKAYYLENGANLTITSCDIEGFEVGIEVGNVGTASTFDIDATSIVDCTYNMYIDHINTFGTFQGSSAHSKIYLHPDNSTVYWGFLDSIDGEFDVTRKISLTNANGSHVDISTLILEGSAMGVLEGGDISTPVGLTVSISAGYGYLESIAGYVIRIDWPTTEFSVTDDSAKYLYINDNYPISGNLSQSNTLPDIESNIVFGRVITQGGSIILIDNSKVDVHHVGDKLKLFNRNALGSIYDSGSIVTTATYSLDVTDGSYYFGSQHYLPIGGTGITFSQYVRNGASWTITDTNLVTSQYDNNSGLTGMSASYFTKHTLYVSGAGINQKYLLVVGQTQYDNINLVESAALPIPPTYFIDTITPIASIVVREGTSTIYEVIDIRPVIGFKSTGINSSSLHSNLVGLSADDHTQYLLVSGSRAMQGNLIMASNSITGVLQVNGITIESHASRHLPNSGTDALATGVPESIGTANSEGIKNAFARQDHIHAHGNQLGGTLHATASQSTAGFMSATDKVILDNFTTLTSGSVLFSNGSTIAQNNSNFFWNNVNNRLGIGTSVPSKILDVRGDVIINELIIGRGTANIASNTVLGKEALLNNINAPNVTAIGVSALRANQTGGFTTAVGFNSLLSNTTGPNNTAIGADSLKFNQTGTNNTAVGMSSLLTNISGINNTAIGQDSLRASTGNQNSAVGKDALRSNVGGTNNTAVGLSSLHSNTSGSNNTSVGVNSLYSSISGANNTAIGWESGRYLPNKATAVTVLTDSIMIGYRTSPLADSQTNQIVIGSDANGVGSNSVVIGNDLITKTILKGQIGIGTTTLATSAKVQIESTTQGFLPPRMTTLQVNSIISPVQGLTVFNTDLNTLCFYTTSWQKVTSSAM